MQNLDIAIVRYNSEESDQDLVYGALDYYGVDAFLVQGTVLPGVSENGHPVVRFTGDAEELEKLRAAYDGEGIQLDANSPIYGKDNALTNPQECEHVERGGCAENGCPNRVEGYLADNV